jgi:hypothetical protein
MSRLLFVFPAAALWVALLALTYLVIRALGWAKVRQHGPALLVLAASLLSLPAAALLRLALPYKDRFLAVVTFRHGVALNRRCPIFPENNIWNTPVRDLPLDAHSQAYVQSIGPGLRLHADFGVSGGIPAGLADSRVAAAQVTFTDGASDSEPGPYLLPDNSPNEGGTDRHVLVINTSACQLYELYDARRVAPGQWVASSGAIFDLRSNRLRPYGWTSADAAGLPIFPGLVRYEEVETGIIRHALRFTARVTRRAFVWPARHFASRSNDPALPPMGQRFRLRRTFDLSGFHPETQVILTALRDYGMMLADNGGPWFLTGEPDSRWKSRVISELGRVSGSDFEAVDTSSLMLDVNSAEAKR